MPLDVAAAFTLSPEDARRVAALRARDEATFVALVQEHGPAMLRLARVFVGEQAVAEEVVQQAWLGVLRGIDRFEGRSSLRTWIFRIVANLAQTRARREGRTVPFSALGENEAAVGPERFDREGRFIGHWAAPPRPWHGPEGGALGGEVRSVVARAIAELPPAQATVLTMRDVVGFDAAEVCNVLEISETNQRVLLHRARSRVRQAVEDYLRT